jgi:hypothetical protein
MSWRKSNFWVASSIIRASAIAGRSLTQEYLCQIISWIQRVYQWVVITEEKKSSTIVSVHV